MLLETASMKEGGEDTIATSSRTALEQSEEEVKAGAYMLVLDLHIVHVIIT